VGESGTMLFLGTYEHTIDEKNRLVLPSKFVSELSKTVYISKGFDGCLEIREEEDFDKYVKRLLSYSNTSKDARQVQRTFLSLSSKTEIDSAKRILIPSNLRNKANLTKDVVIIGVGKTIEV
jgi:MraZ protein